MMVQYGRVTQSQSFTLDMISGAEHGGVGCQEVGAVARLTRDTMVRFHAATYFGDLAVSIAACWHPVAHRDREEEKTTKPHRRHLQDKVSASIVCPQSIKMKKKTPIPTQNTFLHEFLLKL